MATLFIKNMVCVRCLMVVRQEAEKLGLHPVSLDYGELFFEEEQIPPDKLEALGSALEKNGFEIIDDARVQLIEAVKGTVIRIIHHNDAVHLKMNWSDIIVQDLPYEYNYISNLFSGIVGITLEQFIIRQKIERVKELLLYDELNLTQIADKLGYSSVAHLSGQFRKVTGFTPSELKRTRSLDSVRRPLDAVS